MTEETAAAWSEDRRGNSYVPLLRWRVEKLVAQWQRIEDRQPLMPIADFTQADEERQERKEADVRRAFADQMKAEPDPF
jgi:hypothetical protein